jgi:hypothetical protein
VDWRRGIPRGDHDGILDLEGLDEFTAAVNHFFASPRDKEVAARIKISQVSGVKPTVPKAGLVGRAVSPQIPLEKRSATKADVSHTTRK